MEPAVATRESNIPASYLRRKRKTVEKKEKKEHRTILLWVIAARQSIYIYIRISAAHCSIVCAVCVYTRIYKSYLDQTRAAYGFCCMRCPVEFRATGQVAGRRRRGLCFTLAAAAQRSKILKPAQNYLFKNGICEEHRVCWICKKGISTLWENHEVYNI